MARDDNPRHCTGCGKSEHEVDGLVKCRSYVLLCETCVKGAQQQFDEKPKQS
jgi:hypothetical protein